MSVTVIVGGQFGSEGKGKVAHFWAQERKAQIAIRVGGSNSGHTVIEPTGNPLILRQLPTAAILPDVICVIGAGSYIDPDVLLNEIDVTGISKDRVYIDPNAMVISKADINTEEESQLRKEIGSTLSGTGAAIKRRIWRDSSVKLAIEEEKLKNLVRPVVPFLRHSLDEDKRIIIEGTQGFGLSLLHSPDYPYVTSRDTTAASFVSEAGLSPFDVDEIILVLRAFPIRVSGNSGPLPNEIDWDTVTKNAGSDELIIEYSSVTRTIRRVARFHPDVVHNAMRANKPSHIILNHLDYIDAACKDTCTLTDKAAIFVNDVERILNQRINYVGLGPDCTVKNTNQLVSIGDANGS